MIDKKTQAYLRHRHQMDNVEAKADFKMISSNVKKAIRAEKVKYYSKILDENYDKPKKYWELINGKRGKKEKKEIKAIHISGELIIILVEWRKDF